MDSQGIMELGNFETIRPTRVAKLIKRRLENAQKMMEDGVIPSRKDGDRYYTTGIALKRWAEMEADAAPHAPAEKKTAARKNRQSDIGRPIMEALREKGVKI